MVRFKNRYFVVEINGPWKKHEPFNLNPYVLYSVINRKVQQLHGDFGVAAIKNGLQAKYCNSMTRIAFIKVRHGPHKLVASALPFIDRLQDAKVSLNTIYTGATIRQCFKFVRVHQRKKLDQAWATLKTDEERQAYEEAVMNFDISEKDSEMTHSAKRLIE